MGANLGDPLRGSRNPWDIAFDSGFNWLATDNDQSEDFDVHAVLRRALRLGARLEHPLDGRRSCADGTDQRDRCRWIGDARSYDAPQMPPAFASAWFFNDWLRKTTSCMAAMGRRADPAGRRPLAGFRQRRGGAGRAVAYYGVRDTAACLSHAALFRPRGYCRRPDGALYVSGWGKNTAPFGRTANRRTKVASPDFVARCAGDELGHAEAPQAIGQWTIEELLDDLGSLLPVWSVDAQDELAARNGSQGRAHGAAPRQRTDAGPGDVGSVDDGRWFRQRQHRRVVRRDWSAPFAQCQHPGDPNRGPSHPGGPLNRPTARHALRRCRTLSLVFVLPRCRLSLRPTAQRQRHAAGRRSRGERERSSRNSPWQALREIATPDVLRALLKDERGAVRRGRVTGPPGEPRSNSIDVKLSCATGTESRLPPTGWRSRMATRSSTSIRGPATSSTP